MRDPVKDFIRQHGVTRCPTVALVPTQADIPFDPRIAAYHEAIEAKRRENAAQFAMTQHWKTRWRNRQATSLRGRSANATL